jgi:dihydrofolate synthase/folylpolyglutamate synthase
LEGGLGGGVPAVPAIPSAPLSYREAVAAIEARGFGIKPDLDRIRALADVLDHPERTYPTIQVAGTNGKSSTARMIGALLGAEGLTAGVYTSPHLQSLRERFLLAGPGESGLAVDLIQPEELAALFEYLMPIVDLVDARVGSRLTYFELTTAMAFEWMANHAVGAGIYEAGLGGSWDATNIVAGDIGVLTRIAVDHIALLGPTPLDNAREKAGIIKAGQRCVSASQAPDVAEFVAAKAGEVGATLAIMGRDFRLLSDEPAYGGRLVSVEGPTGSRYEEVFVPLLGGHQALNATLAVAACEELVGRALDGEAVAAGFAAVTSPGRLEVVSREPLVVLDGAHNPAAAAALGPALAESFGNRPVVLVISIFADKDIGGILAELLPRARHTIFTRSSSPRAAAGEDLARAAAGLGFQSTVVEPLAAALDAARELATEATVVAVTGSLFAVGEARGILVGPVD